MTCLDYHNAALKKLEAQLKGSLEFKWEEGLTSMVGVNIQQSAAGFELTPPNLINKILKDRWDSTSITSTPLPEGFLASLDKSSIGIKPTNYLSVIGSLSYVAVGTCPDIAYSVNYLACFSSKPTSEHWKGLRHLISYLARTRMTGVRIHPVREMTGQPVKCYCDANWGGTKSRSTFHQGS
jgi:hypothetical protein